MHVLGMAQKKPSILSCSSGYTGSIFEKDISIVYSSSVSQTTLLIMRLLASKATYPHATSNAPHFTPVAAEFAEMPFGLARRKRFCPCRSVRQGRCSKKSLHEGVGWNTRNSSIEQSTIPKILSRITVWLRGVVRLGASWRAYSGGVGQSWCL